MIAFLRGNVWHINEDSLIIDVNGIGYKVYAPMASFDQLPLIGEEITVHTYMQLREDSCTLFGFVDAEQLDMFNILITINGVGAKMAISILNGLTPKDIIFAIQTGNADVFKSISGIGKKIAERIVLELKDKCGKITIKGVPENISQTKTATDGSAVTALTQLGYSSLQAGRMVHLALQELPEDAAIETIITTALRLAAK